MSKGNREAKKPKAKRPLVPNPAALPANPATPQPLAQRPKKRHTDR